MKNKCKGIHCKCMEKDCPNMHYAECTEHNPNLNSNHNTLGSWEEKVKPIIYNVADSMTDRDGMVYGIESKDFETGVKHLIDFIRSLLSQSRKEIFEKVNELVNNELKVPEKWKGTGDDAFGFEEGIKYAKELLNNIELKLKKKTFDEGWGMIASGTKLSLIQGSLEKIFLSNSHTSLLELIENKLISQDFRIIIEKILWKHYNNDEAINGEEISEEIISQVKVLLENIKKEVK